MFKLNSLPVFLNLTTEYCPAMERQRSTASTTSMHIILLNFSSCTVPSTQIPYSNLLSISGWVFFFAFLVFVAVPSRCVSFTPSVFNCSLRICGFCVLFPLLPTAIRCVRCDIMEVESSGAQKSENIFLWNLWTPAKCCCMWNIVSEMLK